VDPPAADDAGFLKTRELGIGTVPVGVDALTADVATLISRHIGVYHHRATVDAGVPERREFRITLFAEIERFFTFFGALQIALRGWSLEHRFLDTLSSNAAAHMMASLIMIVPPTADAELEILHVRGGFERNGAILGHLPCRRIVVYRRISP
jgi:hypothetical protein